MRFRESYADASLLASRTGPEEPESKGFKERLASETTRAK
jgi:hypothetical protein